MYNNKIDNIFKNVLEQLGIINCARQVSASKIDNGRRTYEANGLIFKIVLYQYNISSGLRKQTLEGEFDFLKSLSGVDGVPQNANLHKTKEAIIISYKRLPGIPLSCINISHFSFAMVLWKLKNILFNISKRGVCHNDIHHQNILIGASVYPYIIDFDQANRAPFSKALAANFVGWNNMATTYGSFFGLIKERLYPHIPIHLKQAYRWLRNSRVGRAFRLNASRLNKLPKGASKELTYLHNAWELARRSPANSPNDFICYYSLTLDGFQLPGERPWADRWLILRSTTNVRGKRVLELGCNLSLLSCHLLKEAGAIAALCVDHDPDILSAAQKVSAAYDVSPSYRRTDFDSSEDWESELARFEPDVVTALSVLNWVKDKDRLLAFLGRFDEVLFEGHDTEDVERERLSRHGFKQIELIYTSERNRPVLYARKQEIES